MTDDTADQDALALLRALGQVPAPDSAIAAAARESLWSAVTDELLSADPVRDIGRPRQRETRPPAARPQPGQAPPARRLRRDSAD